MSPSPILQTQKRLPQLTVFYRRLPLLVDSRYRILRRCLEISSSRQRIVYLLLQYRILGHYSSLSTVLHTARLCGAGAFDPALPILDFALRDICTSEEFLSPGLIPAPSNYTGTVFVATGDSDATYWNAAPSTCEEVLTNTKTDLFPSAEFWDICGAKHGSRLDIYFMNLSHSLNNCCLSG